MSARQTAGLSGSKEFQKALQSFGAQARQELAGIVRGTAQNVRSHAVRSIQRGTKSGTVYKKTNPKRTHTASAPGEAPATDTGRLASSMSANIDGLRAEVSANTNYAAELEFGTQRMQPRPFMLPAIEKERPAWNRRLETLVEKVAKGIIK
jgi:HK97 gp10 family phage protein